MTVKTTTVRLGPVTATAGQQDFIYQGKVFDAEDFKVWTQLAAAGSPWVLRSFPGDYSVTNVGQEEGEIQFVVGLAAGDKLQALAIVPDLQGQKLPPTGGMPGPTVETQIDRLTRRFNYLEDRIRGGLFVVDTDPRLAEISLPTPQPGFFVQWNQQGDGFVNIENMAAGNNDQAQEFNASQAAVNFQVNVLSTAPFFLIDGTAKRLSVSDVGLPGTDGLVHFIKGGTAGIGTASGSADVLVLESNVANGASILTPITLSSSLYFGTPTRANDGRLTYSNATRRFSLDATGVSGLITLGNQEVVVNDGGGAIPNFRAESASNANAFLVDAGNGSIHVGNNLLTGAGDGDLVMSNDNWFRFINNAGTSSTEYGITGSTADHLRFNVPAASNAFFWYWGANNRLQIQESSSGAGILFVGESSADHADPGAGDGVIYPMDDGAGNTELFWRNNTNISKVTNSAGVTRGTEQAATSGASIDFTGIPPGVSEITLIFNEVSLSGGEDLLVQLGDSGGFETTGYISAGASGGVVSARTTGFVMRATVAGDAWSGTMTLVRVNDSDLWVSSHSGKASASRVSSGGGSKTLSDELTQLRLTSTGPDTFDAGSLNIIFQ